MISSSSNSIASLIFLIITLMVGAVSVVMFFHWRKYGMDGFGLILAESAYLVGIVLLLGTAFYALN